MTQHHVPRAGGGSSPTRAASPRIRWGPPPQRGRSQTGERATCRTSAASLSQAGLPVPMLPARSPATDWASLHESASVGSPPARSPSRMPSLETRAAGFGDCPRRGRPRRHVACRMPLGVPSGDDLRRLVAGWLDAAGVEPTCAEAVERVMGNPDGSTCRTSRWWFSARPPRWGRCAACSAGARTSPRCTGPWKPLWDKLIADTRRVGLFARRRRCRVAGGWGPRP